jgi:hypothetical protein
LSWILATREELVQVESAMEELLAPYVLRKDARAGEVPGDARLVRIRRHVLPALASQDGEDGGDGGDGEDGGDGSA